MPVASTAAVLHVQAQFTIRWGMLINEDGKSRPSSLDEVEQEFGQDALDRVMSASPHWIDLRYELPTLKPITRKCRQIDVAAFARDCDEISGAIDQASGAVYSDADPSL